MSTRISRRLIPLISTALLVAAPTLSAQHGLLPFYGDAANDEMGRSVSGAGDVNNDGFDDIIVGARGDDTNGAQAGAARVLSGADGSTLYTFFGDSTGDLFGVTVSGAGDVNNDGNDDVIVGAWGDDPNGGQSGSATVYSGLDGSVLHTFNGDAANDRFGISVSGAGDVNNDGNDDLIVGARWDDDGGANAGSARVFSGVDGSTLYTFHGLAAGDEFGYSVSGAGDVNNDGNDDVVVGAYFDDTNGADAGSARVLSGVDGAVLYTFYGDSASDFLGLSVSGAGDVNNDGNADVIAGAYGDDDNGDRAGSARVYSGVDGSTLYTFFGDSAVDYFGSAVSDAGDINEDGYDDLLVGAERDDDNGGSSGSARVLSGVDGSILFTVFGASGNDAFGVSVSSAGDFNGDSHPDFVVGAYGDDTTAAEAGSAQVFTGFSCCTTVGTTCTIAPCEVCPTMVAGTSGGAPTLGNNGFALELNNAPANTQFAILGISQGACVLPGETFLIPFCETIKVAQPMDFLGVMPFTAGISTCTTNISVPAQVPPDIIFVGWNLSMQWVISCDSASIVGRSVSNCVNFTITDTDA